jgi:hypothetical protein
MTGHVGRALRLCVGKRWDFRGRPDVAGADPRGRGAGATLCLSTACSLARTADSIPLAKNGSTECFLLAAMANRHGRETGATGTGKTVTLQTLAVNFSRQGVPVFLADVKGDLTGITQPEASAPNMAALLREPGIEPPPPSARPATLWDVFANVKSAAGHPLRATVSDMGPLLLARMLALNETQTGVLLADHAGAKRGKRSARAQ